MISLLFYAKTKGCSMITFEIKLCADRKLGQEHQILYLCLKVIYHSLLIKSKK